MSPRVIFTIIVALFTAACGAPEDFDTPYAEAEASYTEALDEAGLAEAEHAIAARSEYYLGQGSTRGDCARSTARQRARGNAEASANDQAWYAYRNGEECRVPSPGAFMFGATSYVHSVEFYQRDGRCYAELYAAFRCWDE